MFKYRIACTALILGSAAAFGQANLSDQISAVNSAVTQEKDQEGAERAAREAQYQQQQLARQREAVRQSKIAAAAHAQEQARQDRILADRRAREQKETTYQDQLRDMDLQQKKIQLQAQQTAVNRENDMINQRLKREAAETDLVQSKADATRNISEGDKSLLQDTGHAKVKEASGWFK